LRTTPGRPAPWQPWRFFPSLCNRSLVGSLTQGVRFWVDADPDVNICINEGSITENVGPGQSQDPTWRLDVRMDLVTCRTLDFPKADLTDLTRRALPALWSLLLRPELQ
jgi:hypothetical protein